MFFCSYLFILLIFCGVSQTSVFDDYMEYGTGEEKNNEANNNDDDYDESQFCHHQSGLYCPYFGSELQGFTLVGLCCCARRRVAYTSAAFPAMLDVQSGNRLGGLVVKASTSRAEDPEFKSRLRRDFSGVESYQ